MHNLASPSFGLKCALSDPLTTLALARNRLTIQILNLLIVLVIRNLVQCWYIKTPALVLVCCEFSSYKLLIKMLLGRFINFI